MVDYILLQIIVVPVISSIFILITRKKFGKYAGWIAGLSLLYTTVLLFYACISVYNGQTISEKYPFIGYEITFDLLGDGLSLPVALIINILCTALAFFSIHYVEHRIEAIYGDVDENTFINHYTKFFSLFLGFPLGFMGVCFVQNLIAMYFFLEILPLPLYFIMAFFGYIDRVRVAMICLIWAIAGASFFLAGILIFYYNFGSFNISDLSAAAGSPMTFWIILLILISILVKMAVVPFHVWMPWVHAEHPTCIAGLLAVYANVAIYILVRLIVIPLPGDFKIFSMPLMIMALVTMIYGSLLTMAQTDIKRFAACSTISQLSYSLLGVSSLTIPGIEGGMFFFLGHIMGKTILFSTAGIVVYTTGIRDMKQLGGLAVKMPITAVLWISGAMMLSGFPPMSSFPAEWIMFTGIFNTGVKMLFPGILIPVIGIVAVILTVSYTFRSVKIIFFGPLHNKLEAEKLHDPPITMYLPLLLVIIINIIMGVFPDTIIKLFNNVLGKLPLP